MASTFSVFLEQSFSFFFFLLFFSQSPLPQRSKNRYRGIDRCIDIENGVSISPETQKEMGTKTAYRYGEKMSLSPGVVGYYFSSWKRLTTGPHLQMQDVVRAKEGFLYIKHSRTLKWLNLLVDRKYIFSVSCYKYMRTIICVLLYKQQDTFFPDMSYVQWNKRAGPVDVVLSQVV